ncbi:50S ribosomal protein L6 [Patescibacteria group bacterium]|nr:50S ribosomal protein L6 [Patescibacteria group bacterium]
MSRIGKKPIKIPEEVEVKINGNLVTIKGPKGEQCLKIRPEIKVEIKNYIPPHPSPPKSAGPSGKILVVTPRIETKKTKAFWGLTRSLLANKIFGVITGYEKKLVIEGLGFKANIEGEDLVLRVGFTHPVKIEAPQGIKFSVDKTVITVSGINKELVGQVAAKIRKVHPPEPYKGKGIKYLGEIIKRKPGKRVVTAG